MLNAKISNQKPCCGGVVKTTTQTLDWVLTHIQGNSYQQKAMSYYQPAWLTRKKSHNLINSIKKVVICVDNNISTFHQHTEKNKNKTCIAACTHSVCRHAHTHSHTRRIRAHAEDHPSPSITGCSGVRGHPGLCLFLSHLEAGVTLRAVRSSPPHCSCEDRFHRDKATHCSAHSPFHQMCIITSTLLLLPRPLTLLSLSHAHTHTRSLSRYTHIFHVLSWLRLKAAIVAFFLYWQPIPNFLSSWPWPCAVDEDSVGPTINHFLLNWCKDGNLQRILLNHKLMIMMITQVHGMWYSTQGRGGFFLRALFWMALLNLSVYSPHFVSCFVSPLQGDISLPPQY